MRLLFRRNIVVTSLVILTSIYHRILVVIWLKDRKVEIREALDSLFSESLEARQKVARVDVLKGLKRPELQYRGCFGSLNLTNQLLKVNYCFILGCNRHLDVAILGLQLLHFL